MIRKLSIEGLRGFAKKAVFEPALPNGKIGSGLTVLTGPNNSGKSTLLEALKFLGSVSQTPSFNVGMRNAVTDAVEIIADTQGGIFTIKSVRPGSSEATYNPSSPDVPYVIPSRRYFHPYFSRGSVQRREDFAKDRSSHSEVREQTMSRFESRLFKIEQDRNKFDKVLRSVLPDFVDWSIDQDEHSQYFVKIKSRSGIHSSHGSGDGIISIFVLVSALYDSPEGDIIAIDEPELSLHPRLQKNLATVIDKFADQRQIIVSTHSPYFISRTSLRAGGKIVRLWEGDNSILIRHLDVSSCASLSALLSDNANNPHIFGLDAREIFFENDPVIVFEGQEDVVLWPKLDPDGSLTNASIYGWGSGGAANIANVCSVLKCLGHQKVVGILDNNRPEDLVKLRTDFPHFRFFELPAADIRTKRAVKEKAAVEGVLNERGHIRSEHIPAIDALLQEVREFCGKS